MFDQTQAVSGRGIFRVHGAVQVVASVLKKRLTISGKLLMLVMLVCLCFIFITTLVMLSLNQVRDLFGNVANTQMNRVFHNAQTSRNISSLFSQLEILGASVGDNDVRLVEIEETIARSIQTIGESASNDVRTQLLDLSLAFEKLKREYLAINASYAALSRIEQSTNNDMLAFEQKVGQWLKSDDTDMVLDQLVHRDQSNLNQVFVLLTRYRAGMVRIQELHDAVRDDLLAVEYMDHYAKAIPVIDGLIEEFSALDDGSAAVVKHSHQIAVKLQEYRDEIINLQTHLRGLAESRAGIDVLERLLQMKIAFNDVTTSRTTQSLMDELNSIIQSSGFMILFLSLVVMAMVVTTILAIIRSSIKQPISRILDGIDEFRQGNLLKPINVHDEGEWGVISNALNNMAQDLHESYSELKDSEDKFYQIFENELNALLIFDQATGCCLDANRIALDMYDVTLADISLINLDNIEPPVHGSSVTGVGGLAEGLNDSAEQSGKPGWVKTLHYRKDGSLFPVEVHTGSFQRQGVHYLFKSVRDMTEQTRLQDTQQKTLALLEATLESSSEGVVAFSTSGKVLNFNRNFSTLFKLSAAELPGMHARKLLPKILRTLKDRSDFISMITVSSTGTESITSDVLELKDGRMFECNSQPQILDGEVVGRVWNFRDVSEYFQVMQQLREKENRLQYLAHHDPLTGLANRLLFIDRLEQALEVSKRRQQKLALFFIDLDRFKSINDSLGHVAGDYLLKAFAERLVSTVRKVDTIARLGGDEFTIVLNDIDTPQDAVQVATKILENLRQPFQFGEHQFYVTSSIGISFFPDDGDTAESMVRNADAAMYRSKEEGRNTYHFYTEDMTAKALERVLLEASLRTALEEDQLCVMYQPQFGLDSGQLVGCEALVRWRHPQHGLMLPTEFLPAAEEIGLIIDIDEWVFAHVCAQVARWSEAGLTPSGVRYAVNLSGQQLKHQHLPDTIADIIARTGCDPSMLELEITEGFIMNQPEVTTAILLKLQELGLHLSIDDFGTGYSSLSYLKRLPINKLKIDRSFVQDVVHDSNDAAIAKSVIALGKSMNLQVIAEGVEDELQEAFLKREGCDMAQGFFYSHPLTADEFENVLKQAQLHPAQAI